MKKRGARRRERTMMRVVEGQGCGEMLDEASVFVAFLVERYAFCK